MQRRNCKCLSASGGMICMMSSDKSINILFSLERPHVSLLSSSVIPKRHSTTRQLNLNLMFT
jgi:hypothetical protein